MVGVTAACVPHNAKCISNLKEFAEEEAREDELLPPHLHSATAAKQKDASMP